MDNRALSRLAGHLIDALLRLPEPNFEKKIRVNPVISKVASWYEKLRNAMEYREEEVILRAAIERILKRRLLLGGSAKSIAAPLVRELIWARYLPDDAVPESMVKKVEESIETFLALRDLVLKKHKMSELLMNEWTYHLISSDIEQIINPNVEEEAMSNFIFQILRPHVQITDDTEETRNAQVFLAVRKAYAKDDLAFLRYHMFVQYFGPVNKDNIERVAESFPKGYKEILYQLTYPRKDQILGFVKRRTATFLILDYILRLNKGELPGLLLDPEKLSAVVFAECEKRYNATSSKVTRAIIRSVIFILLTKLVFAFLIEGTYERIFYGHIKWLQLGINTGAPPLLMVIVSLFIKTPDLENSKRILVYIQRVLFDEHPKLGEPLVTKKIPDKAHPILNGIFSLLWFMAFFISFGSIIYVLTRLGFNVVSQGVFLFFLTIVSFLAYRISTIANTYRVGDQQGLTTPLVDFLFVPIIRVGRELTEGISQINVLIFIFDLLIEAPFKVVFAFLEQWFYFLHAKREELE